MSALVLPVSISVVSLLILIILALVLYVCKQKHRERRAEALQAGTRAPNSLQQQPTADEAQVNNTYAEKALSKVRTTHDQDVAERTGETSIYSEIPNPNPTSDEDVELTKNETPGGLAHNQQTDGAVGAETALTNNPAYEQLPPTVDEATDTTLTNNPAYGQLSPTVDQATDTTLTINPAYGQLSLSMADQATDTTLTNTQTYEQMSPTVDQANTTLTNNPTYEQMSPTVDQANTTLTNNPTYEQMSPTVDQAKTTLTNTPAYEQLLPTGPSDTADSYVQLAWVLINWRCPASLVSQAFTWIQSFWRS